MGATVDVAATADEAGWGVVPDVVDGTDFPGKKTPPSRFDSQGRDPKPSVFGCKWMENGGESKKRKTFFKRRTNKQTIFYRVASSRLKTNCVELERLTAKY